LNILRGILVSSDIVRSRRWREEKIVSQQLVSINQQRAEAV